MSGGGSSSHRTSGVKGLAEGAGEINALTPKENFGDRPHQNADTGCTKAGTARIGTIGHIDSGKHALAAAIAVALATSPTRGGSHG